MIQRRKRKNEVMVIEPGDLTPMHRANGDFAKGHVKVGGRQPGTPNKGKKALRDWMEEAATLEGADGKGKDGYLKGSTGT